MFENYVKKLGMIAFVVNVGYATEPVEEDANGNVNAGRTISGSVAEFTDEDIARLLASARLPEEKMVSYIDQEHDVIYYRKSTVPCGNQSEMAQALEKVVKEREDAVEKENEVRRLMILGDYKQALEVMDAFVSSGNRYVGTWTIGKEGIFRKQAQSWFYLGQHERSFLMYLKLVANKEHTISDSMNLINILYRDLRGKDVLLFDKDESDLIRMACQEILSHDYTNSEDIRNATRVLERLTDK